MVTSINEDRKTKKYRFLEGIIGYTSIGFLIILLITSIINPVLASVFLIVYSFMWLFKYTLNVIYTVYTYLQLRRWEALDWAKLFNYFNTDLSKAITLLNNFSHKYKNKIDLPRKIESQIRVIDESKNTKFANPNDIFQVCIFSIYNENSEVLAKSLKCIYESEYNLDKIVVFVSQEGRYGEEENTILRNEIKKIDWINSYNQSEKNLDIVYNSTHPNLNYKSKIFECIELFSDKLNIIFTQHPDGLIGEIKGKSSNEDWGGRQASLFLKSQSIDPETSLVTSLDADSHISPYFFHHLSFTFCTTPNRLASGYQPIHSYSNNFYETGLWPRQVATQTGLANLTNLGIEGETPFFAIYSVPMCVLQDVNFWVREVIAEDAMMFNKCLIHFDGNFKVVPFYGVFEGDAVEAEDFIEGVLSQYLQLQRWAWGGIEDFPYIYKNFFWTEKGRKIDLRVRLKWTYLKFSNHVFWSSSPVIFSIGMLFPQIFGGDVFRQTQTFQNLIILSQFFAWASFIFIVSFGYITYEYFAFRASKKQKLTPKQIGMVFAQLALSPFLYGLMGIPALDAQIRGIRGKYLGYWVTPKK
ncbi:MAG: hypothetical protein H7196_03940 [candidate division SR1 bacterium]|nr:hypothetical protein [candidate division SR1 bacterium]